MKTELSKKQIKFLKAQAHALSPVVRVGQHGLSDALYNELNIALDHHELVKVKVAADDRDARSAMLENMSKKTKSHIVQSIGSMVVLYRQNKDKPVISFSQDDR